MKISRQDVATHFCEFGVVEGDTIFLHCDALGTLDLLGETFTQKADTLFDGILDLLGPKGTLVLPTFTYSATKGNNFNVQETKSEVGLLTEYFRKRPGVKRSSNPIFSVAAIGQKAIDFELSSVYDCFGQNTCFDILYNQNGWIFTLGCSFDRVTFIHYVDQTFGVDHRFFKHFTANVINDNILTSFQIRYLVRDLTRKTSTKLDALKNRLIYNGKLQITELGRPLLIGVHAQDFFQCALDMIKEKPNIHILEGYEI
jgi:aminoglycoside 3-N-acetyltransferase